MAGPQHAAALDSSRLEALQKYLADVRHLLALRLEVVAQVSQRLAEVCNEIEMCIEEARLVTEAGEPPAAEAEFQRRQAELSTQMRELWEDLGALEAAPDWWLLVQGRLQTFDGDREEPD